MAKQIKEFDNGLKFLIDDDKSNDECHILTQNSVAEDYIPFSFFDINDNDTVIDIGAHVGRFSIYAAFKAKNGRVYSFEPDSRNLGKFIENIKLNGIDNISYFEKVVNKTGDSQTLYLSDDSAENSLYANSRTSVSKEISGITLARIFEDNRIEKCDFLKLDCEGAEYDILFSLPKNYFSKIDKIALEYHDNLYSGKSLKDLIFLLSKNNFIIHKVNRGAWYLGLLYASRSRLAWNKSLIFLRNYFRAYAVDFVLFLAILTVKRLNLFFNKK